MSILEHRRLKFHRTVLPIAIVLLICISIVFKNELISLLIPILFLIVVLAALHFTRRVTIITVILVSLFSLFIQDPSTSNNAYWLWGVRSIVFLMAGLIINYEFENMRKIQRYTEERNAISSVSHSLTSTLDLKQLTERVVDTIIELFSAYGCRIYLLNEETRELLPIACKEIDTPPEIMKQIMEVRVRVGFGLVGWVAATGESILSGDAERDSRSFHIPGTPYDEESVIAVPLQTDDKTYGVLLVNKLGLHVFNNEDLQLAQIFADQVSIALANAQLYEHVRRLSETDSLTGLLNSRSLSRIVEHLINQAQANSSSVSVLFIDLDDFKSINDRFGHPMGDKFLRFFAQILQISVRDEDIAIRYAGDEFVVILPNSDLPKAKVVAERLMEDIRNKRMGDIPALSTTVSVGLAVYPQHANSAEDLIKHADDALYVVKRNGKDQLAVYLEEVSGA